MTKTKTQCSSTFSKCKTDHMTDPLFLSETGLSLSRTDTVKYPAILKIDDKMRSLLWVPEEIKVSADAGDMKKFSDSEKRIFTETLLRATMLDSIQGRSPTTCLLPICTNPELELAIETWSFTETIHSKSYSYLIKNIYQDPTVVFDNLMDISGITDCADSISEYYDVLIKFNASRELQLEGYNEYDHKVAIYKCLTAINALESIRFYSAFAVFFNFAQNSSMMGTAKVLQMIARDESYHVGLTNLMFKYLVAEDSDYSEIKEQYRDDLALIYNDVVRQEVDWVGYIFEDGSLLGLNKEMLSDYIYYLARQRIKVQGFDDHEIDFPVVTSNPLPWMNDWLNTANMQSAPQEIEVINYKAGSIDTNDDDIADFEL